MSLAPPVVWVVIDHVYLQPCLFEKRGNPIRAMEGAVKKGSAAEGMKRRNLVTKARRWRRWRRRSWRRG
eukprot:1918273-Pleurochrysis_carterae.AAC.1